MSTKQKITRTISKSKWARRFKRNCPTGYKGGLELARFFKNKVYLGVYFYYNNESGIYQWSILAINLFFPRKWESFWLDSFPTKKQAVQCCREMG